MSLFKKKKDSSQASSAKEVKKTKETSSQASSQEKKAKNISTKIKKNDYSFASLIIRPVITEKGTMMAGENNCYAFEISPRANKISIKRAIEEIYKVTPLKVNIINKKGKRVRYGRSQGRTKKTKKALVFLRKGDHIEFANSA
ncbi:50S ribosomal protein L23 [Patescibacteria group bacterium]|nr:50S ribosomal protein L23 [Patescibacteria group bacterium]